MTHDVDHRVMDNCVKGFGKVQFEQHYLMGLPLALVDIFKRPSKAVLDGPPLNETVLVSIDDNQDNFLQTVGQYFGDDFQTAIQLGYWPIVIGSFRR